MRVDACFDNNNAAETMLNYTSALPSVRCFGICLSVTVCIRKMDIDVFASSRVCLGGFWVDSDWITAAKACACARKLHISNCMTSNQILKFTDWYTSLQQTVKKYNVQNISLKSIRTANCLLNLFKNFEYKILQNAWRMKKHHGKGAGTAKAVHLRTCIRVICLELSQI